MRLISQTVGGAPHTTRQPGLHVESKLALSHVVNAPVPIPTQWGCEPRGARAAMLAALLPLRAPAFSPVTQVAPERFDHPLLRTPGLGKGRNVRQLRAPVERSWRAVAASARARARASGPRLCLESEPAPAPADRARGYGKEEDKALRLCRTSFGGYPAGAYYELEQAEGLEAAYAVLRSDHPALADWSDAEIGLALKELKTTPLEVLTDTPIGPFLVLSAIAIWRDGMGPWGIAPCREYLDVCAPGGLLSFMYFGQKPF